MKTKPRKEGPGQDHTVARMRSQKKKKREKSDHWASDRLHMLGQKTHEWCREFKEPQKGPRSRKQV